MCTHRIARPLESEGTADRPARPESTASRSLPGGTVPVHPASARRKCLHGKALRPGTPDTPKADRFWAVAGERRASARALQVRNRSAFDLGRDRGEGETQLPRDFVVPRSRARAAARVLASKCALEDQRHPRNEGYGAERKRFPSSEPSVARRRTRNPFSAPELRADSQLLHPLPSRMRRLCRQRLHPSAAFRARSRSRSGGWLKPGPRNARRSPRAAVALGRASSRPWGLVAKVPFTTTTQWSRASLSAATETPAGMFVVLSEICMRLGKRPQFQRSDILPPPDRHVLQLRRGILCPKK